jgi:hypothetical protein
MARCKTARRFPWTTYLWAAVALFHLVAIPTRANASSEETELVALSNAWIDAEVRHDRAALEQLLDERFLVTLSSGKTVGRAAFIDLIMKADIKPFEVFNEAIDVHGDTALVISTTKDQTIKFTWVAVKKEGRWQVISETLSRIAPPK